MTKFGRSTLCSSGHLLQTNVMHMKTPSHCLRTWQAHLQLLGYMSSQGQNTAEFEQMTLETMALDHWATSYSTLSDGDMSVVGWHHQGEECPSWSCQWLGCCIWCNLSGIPGCATVGGWFWSPAVEQVFVLSLSASALHQVCTERDIEVSIANEHQPWQALVCLWTGHHKEHLCSHPSCRHQTT